MQVTPLLTNHKSPFAQVQFGMSETVRKRRVPLYLVCHQSLGFSVKVSLQSHNGEDQAASYFKQSVGELM